MSRISSSVPANRTSIPGQQMVINIDLPVPRSSHDSLIVGDKIYVVGGWQMKGKDSSSTWLKTVEVLDLAAEKPEWRSIEQPFIRRALSIAVVGDELFCMGGLDNGGDTSLEVDILNLETEEWHKGPDLPEGPMDGFGLAGLVDSDDGKLYITGFSGTVYTYNGKEAWDEVAQFEHGRFFSRFVDPPNADHGTEKRGRSPGQKRLSNCRLSNPVCGESATLPGSRRGRRILPSPGGYRLCVPCRLHGLVPRSEGR